MPGNDDLRILDPMIEKICAKYPLAENIARKKTALGPVEMVGMNLVTDAPFLLKDRFRMDSRDFVFPPQSNNAVLSCRGVNGLEFEDIEDWPAYAMTLPTIEEELLALPKPEDPKNAVYVIHGPPEGAGLDVCYGNRAVGSRALTRFLEKTRPLSCFSGHIHESFDVSDVWKAKIGRTTCVQPGQRPNELVFVEVETGPFSVQRVVIEAGR